MWKRKKRLLEKQNVRSVHAVLGRRGVLWKLIAIDLSRIFELLSLSRASLLYFWELKVVHSFHGTSQTKLVCHHFGQIRIPSGCCALRLLSDPNIATRATIESLRHALCSGEISSFEYTLVRFQARTNGSTTLLLNEWLESEQMETLSLLDQISS